MKHLITAIACCLAVAGSAQTEWPWNPDFNDDNIIGSSDLLAMLSAYGYEAIVETCSQGDLCRCDYYDYSVTNAQTYIYYPPASCGVLYTKKTGGSSTYKKIRLSPDADSSDVVNIVQAGSSANGNSYTGHIYYETLINGVWETLFSMSHNEPNNPRMLRYVFNGEYWVDAEATEQMITPE